MSSRYCDHYKTRLCLLFLFFVLPGARVMLADRYVVPTNDTSHVAAPPYTNWADAATNIQDAVNVATNAGETVWVSNGTYYCSGISTCIHYETGIGPAPFTNTAMVVVTNPITIKGVNGYANTIVNGNYPTISTKVFIVDSAGAVLSGLTITNGLVITNVINASLTTVGAGVKLLNGTITNCLITGNSTSNDYVYLDGSAIAMVSGIVTHCSIIGNKMLGTRAHSILYIHSISNRTSYDIISNCIFAYNTYGHAAGESTIGTRYGSNVIYGCTFYSNSANFLIRLTSGYSYPGSIVERCVITNNALDTGVYIYEKGTVRNCLITIRGANAVKLGQYGGNVENCTLANSFAGIRAATSTDDPKTYIIRNNIIYDNSYTNFSTTNLYYTNCCTFPLPPLGSGNITNPPSLMDTNSGNYRLAQNSPCINAGANQSWMTNGVDLDGRNRIRYGTVDMGAYERMNNGTIYSAH